MCALNIWRPWLVPCTLACVHVSASTCGAGTHLLQTHACGCGPALPPLAGAGIQPAAGGLWQCQDGAQRQQLPLWQVRGDQLQSQGCDLWGCHPHVPSGTQPRRGSEQSRAQLPHLLPGTPTGGLNQARSWAGRAHDTRLTLGRTRLPPGPNTEALVPYICLPSWLLQACLRTQPPGPAPRCCNCACACGCACSCSCPQLCEGASPEEKQRWRLTKASDYHYLSQSSCYELTGVDNAEEYKVGAYPRLAGSTGRRQCTQCAWPISCTRTVSGGGLRAKRDPGPCANCGEAGRPGRRQCTLCAPHPSHAHACLPRACWALRPPLSSRHIHFAPYGTAATRGLPASLAWLCTAATHAFPLPHTPSRCHTRLTRRKSVATACEWPAGDTKPRHACALASQPPKQQTPQRTICWP